MEKYRPLFLIGYGLLAFGLIGLLFLFLYFGPAEMLRYPTWIPLISIITSMLVAAILIKVKDNEQHKEQKKG